jgi:hypothetical protein
VGLGVSYGAQANYRGWPNHTDRYSQRFSTTYVTGTHSFKTGIQVEQLVTNAQYIANGNVNYTFRNGVPISLTQWATPYLQQERGNEVGIYAQDQWSLGKWTLNLGVRYDWYYGWVPAQSTPGDTAKWPGAPTRNEWLGERSYDKVTGIPSWMDLNPRVGAAYDIFGNGRTAVKLALGRYVAKTNVDVPAALNPITTSVNSASRAWTDTNRNFVPDCDLGNFAANGECAQIGNQNFGKNNPRAVRWSNDVLQGWGVRDSNWDFSSELQHQLRDGLSMTTGYYFNTGGYFRNTAALSKNRRTDNLRVAPGDYDPYCVTAPSDPRLPGGGGYQVCGLYDINPSKFGQFEEVVSLTENYGTPSYQNHFVNATFDARLRGGARVGGGIDTGWSLRETCYVVDSPQDLLNCRVTTPFGAQTQIKLNGSYPLPYDIVVAGTFQNLSGPAYEANYDVTSAEVARSLGRPLAGNTPVVRVPLVPPNTLFEDRLTRLDVRVSKILRLRRARIQLNLDAYNALNSSAIIAVNSVLDARWRQPNSVIDPRLFQVSAQVNF